MIVNIDGLAADLKRRDALSAELETLKAFIKKRVDSLKWGYYQATDGTLVRIVTTATPGENLVYLETVQTGTVGGNSNDQ